MAKLTPDRLSNGLFWIGLIDVGPVIQAEGNKTGEALMAGGVCIAPA